MVQMRSEKHTKRKYNRKRVFETILSLLILLAIFSGALTGYYGSKIVSFLDGISSETSNEPSDPDTIEVTRKIEDLEPFSGLILGLDVEDDGSSRSDTIIVVTVNPEEESVKMVSIPRDTLVTLPNGQLEKINAAYATGNSSIPNGPANNAMEAVGEFLDIPIQFFATMDFDGLVELVDAVGGITVDADFAFTQSDYVNRGETIRIQEGIQTLNGAEALGYARMRKRDPRGDFGRQGRQREVIVEVLNELVSFNTVTNLSSILNAIQPYLNTNATPNQMLSIATNYTDAVNDIDQLEINGYDGTEYFPHYGHNVYVWQPYQESLTEVQYELRKHLELDTEDYMDIQPEIENAHSSENGLPSESESQNSY